MEIFERTSKRISRLCLLIILFGIIEILMILVFSDKYFYILLGLFTIIPAYLTFPNHNKRKSILIAILTFVKYNPISLGFIVGFFLSSLHLDKNHQSPVLSLIPLLLLIYCGAFITVGIFLTLSIKKYNRLIENNIENNHEKLMPSITTPCSNVQLDDYSI